ncbi:MAG: energy-coupling factor transporter ATPase [Candidatus Bathyarchaeia archaeon]
MSLRNSVAFENFSYRYKGSVQPALKNVSLEIEKGEFVAILGRTDAGKSTFCRALNGIIPHYFGGEIEGRVIVDDVDTRNTTISELARKVGFVFQDPDNQLFSLEVEDDVAFGPENLALPLEEITRRTDWALSVTRLEGYRERAPHTLSGGQKQEVAIAGVLAMYPDILVLDEPTSQLDPIGTQMIWSTIKDLNQKLGMTVIISTQDIEEVARFAERLLVLSNGVVTLDGKVREVFGNVEAMQAQGISPPMVTQLFSRLSHVIDFNFKLPITTDEANTRFRQLMAGIPIQSDKGREELMDGCYATQAPEVNSLIMINDLWHTYPDTKNPAISGITLGIKRGEMVAIIGQNGSGKSTVVKHLNGLLKPTRGTVVVDGTDTRTNTVAELSKKVGYVFQNPDNMLFSENLESEVSFGLKNLGLKEEEIQNRISTVLETMNLVSLRKENPRFFSLSDRARSAIASVVAMKPEAIILDEPTTGQDFSEALEIMEFMQKMNRLGNTVIFVTHNMELVAHYAKRVIVLCEGKVLLDGTPKYVFSRPDTLSKTYLHPPQITCFAQMINEFGIAPDTTSVDEMYEAITKMLLGKRP